MKTQKWALGVLAVLTAFGSGGLLFIAAAVPTNTPAAYWVENQGQFDEQVLFRSEGTMETAWVLEDSIWLTYQGQTPLSRDFGPGAAPDDNKAAVAHTIRLSFDQAGSPVAVSGLGQVDITRNFLTPAGTFEAVPLWDRLAVEGLANGASLEAGMINGRIVIHVSTDRPADPVRLRLDGAESVRIDGGRVVMGTQVGEQTLLVDRSAPGITLEITANGETLRFSPPQDAAAAFPESQAPTVSTQIYGGFHGQAGLEEFGNAITVDEDQNAYIAGSGETPVDLPEEPGPHTPTHLVSAFVLKLNPTGTGVVYLTTITGTDPNGEEFAQDIAIDGSRSAYITGMTSSTDFPTTVGAYDTTPNQNNMFDGWLVKLNPNGGIVFSTVIGTNAHDLSYGVGLGLFGQIVIAGFTAGAAFPTTSGVFDGTFNGGYDTFVSIFNNDGSDLVHSTLIGGSGNDGGLFFERADITVDRVGNVFLTGPTSSTDFPSTSSKIGPGGCVDLHITKFTPTLHDIYFATRIGGSGTSCGVNGDEYPQRMVIDGTGNIYITGYTSTPQGNGFPVTAGAFDTTYNGGAYDAFMLKFNATTFTVRYGTYLGGESVDVGKDMAIGQDGTLYLTGYTYSAAFPTSVDAFDPTLSGPNDAYLVKLDAASFAAADLIYGSYIGGTGTDEGYALYTFGTDIVYLTGLTTSGNFPIVPGSWDTAFSGDRDAFITLFHLSLPNPPHPRPTWTPAPEAVFIPVAPNQSK